jgi:membrane-associated phospholipid phosphatase
MFPLGPIPTLDLAALSTIAGLDHEAMAVTQGLRWGPFTAFFALASAWWVKGPLLIAVGGLGDARGLWREHGRDKCLRVPLRGAAVATAAFFAASTTNLLLKAIFTRARPPLTSAELTSSVPVPDSYSFPSGHAMSAFAVATAIAIVYPRLRLPAFGIAAAVALSRPYLGVHFWSDVIAGAVVGALVGLAAANGSQVLFKRLRSGGGPYSGAR